jgi:hypothetical protein
VGISKGKLLIVVASFSLGAGSLPAAIMPTIFFDDFESGNLNNWTTTATNPFTIDSTRNAVPGGGIFSALQDISTDRMHHNIIADNGGVEPTGTSTFTSWIFDSVIGGSTTTRIFNEVRGHSGGSGLPNGGTVISGTLAQLLAIGKFNTVTKPGEVFNINKYQGRVTFGTDPGWFNLDGPGAPDRSVGWHKFTIERLGDETTINFYVDDILSRTFLNATPQSWDTLIMGSGLGSTATDSSTDGFEVTVPEPASLTIVAATALGFLARRRRRA